jgi:RND family efflux transporter MFP subunit
MDDTKDVWVDAPPPPSPVPPHGPRLRIVLPVLALLVIALAVGVIWSEGLRTTAARAMAVLYPAPPQTAAQSETTQYYTCGMHPWVVLPAPGDCPICHMTLVPIDPAKFTGEIAINPIITQNIGVRIAPVTTGPVKRIVRTLGTVDYNETLVRDVNLKVSGWVEKLYVNATGQEVDKDQPLLEIYSPDLYSAQVDYLLAFRKEAAVKTAPGADADTAASNQSLLASARRRLEYLDVSAAQIKELETSGQAAKTMTLRSPFRGTVIVKNVVEGQKVEAGAQLLRIADISKVWVLVTVYEYQIPYIELGQRAVMSLPYIPGQTFEGKVTYVYPYLNSELRQAKVRLELDNPGGLLKPGMYANVELQRTLATDRTLVPREAVIDTGVRQVAYVSLGEGRFEPRQVQVGVETEGGMLEILDGLKPGERVVTSGEFLLDSEARLHEALAKMVKGNLAADQKTGAASEETKPAEKPPAPKSSMPGMPGM